eukprot:71356_1
MALKQVELAPKNDEYVVFGYTREAGTKLHMNISTPIKYICLNYYFAEHFAHYENNIEINDTKDTIKNNGTGTGPIVKTPVAIGCGYIEIDPNLNIFSKYKWTFKIKSFESWLSIGITASDQLNLFGMKDKAFSYRPADRMLDDIFTDFLAEKLFCEWKYWKQEDIIDVILHVSIGKLELLINNRSVRYLDIKLENKSHRLAVAMETRNEIQLIKFKAE